MARASCGGTGIPRARSRGMVIYYHDSAGSYVTRNHFAMIIVVNKSSCPMSGRFKWFGGNCFGAGLAPRAPPEDSKVVGAVVRTTVTVQRCRRDLSWNDSSGPTLSFAMPSDPFIAPVRVTTFPAVVIRPTEDPKKFVNHSAASGPVVISQGPCPAPHRAGWRPLASLQPRTRPPRLTADRDEQRSGVSARLPGQAQSFLGIRKRSILRPYSWAARRRRSAAGGPAPLTRGRALQVPPFDDNVRAGRLFR